jgi:hypothetical protein
MARSQAGREPLEGLQAQYLVCDYLARSCRQAIVEMALNEADGEEVRRRAVRLLKDILADWADAQLWLKRELSMRQKASSLTAR